MTSKTFHSSFRRFWEIFPWAISLGIIFLPVVFSPMIPKAVAVFVVLYTFLWFLRAIEYSGFLLFSFGKFQKYTKRNWQQKLQNLETGINLSASEKELRTKLQKNNDWIDPAHVHHLIIVATCGEDIAVLRQSFSSLVEAEYDKKNLWVCLATEERKHNSGRANAKIIQQEFGDIFGRFFWIEHPDGIAGEVRGKGGNITYAGKQVSQKLQAENVDFSRVVVTSLDADNRVDRQYFSCLTYHYVLQEHRKHKSYQPIPLFYNNIWSVPFLNRMLAISSGFWHMIESGRPDRLRNFSSHAQPLDALYEMDFWAVDTIVEDGHQFWRSYLHFSGQYEVIPIFIPIYQDAVLNNSYYRSLTGQYKQMRRWAWGCSDIPFCAEHFWKQRTSLPAFKTLLHFLRLLEGHIMWSTAAIFITLTTPVPRMINIGFSETNMAANMAYLLQIFFMVALCGILVSMALSLLTLPKAPSKKKRSSLIWQWIFLPFMTILMGAFPALEAQFRLACKKPLEFNVTEKVKITS